MLDKTKFEKPLSEYLCHDYYRKISPYIRDKNVLDVGCVDHDIERANHDRPWNHWFIYKLAKNSLGIDVEEKSIRVMSKAGFNVKVMDAENINFINKFDTIFAGELIEHLPNPGVFLKRCSKALTKGGKIILTTPNTYSVPRLVRVFQLMTNDPPVNPDHTLYLTPKTVTTLAQKCGLKISKIDYAHYPFSGNNLFAALNKIVCNILGNKFKGQMLVFIEK